MFTGIVEEVGAVRQIVLNGKGKQFQFSCKKICPEIKLGDSISCNGVCLTATELRNDGFTAFAVEETLSKSILNAVKVGDPINFELALRPDSRLGGHYVTGHIDGRAVVSGINVFADKSREMSLTISQELIRYCIKKGSVALNGVSLTIADVQVNQLVIALIPHTLDNTNLGKLKVGNTINIEVDMMGKYAEKMLAPYTSSNKGVTEEMLTKLGYHA
jgi:riboflavin synthase